MNQRRHFLRNTGLGLGALFLGSPEAMARSQSPKKERILVVVFQRGGMDGLMAVPPTNDASLRKLRPTLAMNMDSLLPLGDRFALHPSLAELAPLYNRKELAVI